MPDQHELHRDPGLSENMVQIELSLLLQIPRRKGSTLKEKISNPREKCQVQEGLEITVENEDGFKIILVLPVDVS